MAAPTRGSARPASTARTSRAVMPQVSRAASRNPAAGQDVDFLDEEVDVQARLHGHGEPRARHGQAEKDETAPAKGLRKCLWRCHSEARLRAEACP